MKEQRLPKLDDRTDLWKVPVVITARKVVAQQRRHFALTRPDAQAKDEAALDAGNPDRALEQVLGEEPTPELATQFAEEFGQRLDVLPDDDYKQIALWRLEGYKNREIAEKLGWYEVKVERKLRVIRKCWSDVELNDERA